MSLEGTLKKAIDLHRAGSAAQADALYREVLTEKPDHAQALNLLGVLAMQTNRSAEAAQLLARATAAGPGVAEYHLNLGAALDQTGRLDAAMASYRQALSLKADSAQALSNLGNGLRRQGKLPEAIAMCRRALAVQPEFAEAYNNLGAALQASGAINEAIEAYAQAVARRGNSSEFMRNLAGALDRGGRLADSISVYRKTLSMAPLFADAWVGLAQALRQCGQFDDAHAACRQAITLRPNLLIAHQETAKIYFDQGKFNDSVSAYRRAIELSDSALLHNNLGSSLLAAGDRAQAEAEFRRAIAMKPDYSFAYNNLGVVLYTGGDLINSAACFRRSAELTPDYPEAYNNLGTALKYSGQYNEALANFNHSLTLRPDNAAAHWNTALIHLLRGDFHRGWPEYEWRWRVPELLPPRRNFSQPQWDGAELSDRRILLYTEQGFGDAIQFARYAPLVARLNAKVIVRCQNELARLFRSLAGVERVISADETPPDFDLHCPLMSLPMVFKTDITNMPRDVPYLSAEPQAMNGWIDRIAALAGNGKKVGLSWAGRPTHPKDKDRSIAPARLAPLADISGVRLFSLQKRPASAAPQELPMALTDWTDELNDFADTAALIANLDLIVTVDTAVAHLAAALGKPTWVLLPWVPDWRWMLERRDSPWYPTMKLFRQPQAGDWDRPLAELTEALKNF